MKISRIFRALFISLFLLSVFSYADIAVSGAEIHSPINPEAWISGAWVKDISDRAYEGAVIQLLDSAKESIIMSMYILKSGNSGPVRLLVRDLEEALDRGVSVEIYINTRPGHGMASGSEMDTIFKPLTDRGANIHKFTPYYLLHDKLIIVDARYVVEGSANWSAAALKSNYESAVLIDSPELAKAKLIRLRRFPLEDYRKNKKAIPDRPKSLGPLPVNSVVELNKELLTNNIYFAAMLNAHADRAMDIYLILLSESVRARSEKFFISLEELAVTVGMDPVWSDTELRRQMIKVLKKLKTEYGLIDVSFSYGKDAWVELKPLPEIAIKVSGDFFRPERLAKMNSGAKFVYLMKALLESEGRSIDSMSLSDLSGRFGISQWAIRKGLKEIQSGDEI